MQTAPVREVALGADAVKVERRSDGSLLLRSPNALGAYPERFTERLGYWALEAPGRVFIAQRDGQGAWKSLSYSDMHSRVRSLGRALLDRKLSADRPVAILSENDLEHAQLALACMHVGIPYLPVSSAYSLVSSDHARLRYVMELMTPGLVFAADGDKYGKAIRAAVPEGTEICTQLSELLAAVPGTTVDEAHARVRPETIAKFLLTSGSTGQPKAVINTHRMLCANQQMLAQSLPSLTTEPPVLVDWLPWNHTAGGNHNLGLVLYNGGTLYIDEGRPVPGLIERTARNLRDVAPTIYFNVPRGYDALLPYLRDDEALRRNFFSRLGLIQYAAAVLSQPTWKAYEELALQSCGERILWITGYGATETAPAAMFTNRGARRAGTVGLPVDGLEMKLAPVADKLEARFRGPSITPGYWRRPELSAAAFDEEGYYRTGDALRFLDAADPAAGMEFDGRLTEDFKLGTGTWVSVGPLRVRFNAAASPLVHDIVVTGHDRDELGALVFLNPAAAAGLDAQAQRARIQEVLARLAREATGSSTRIARAMIMEAPPSIDAGEITDKGTINQRAVLERRGALVEELYREPFSQKVIRT